MEQLTWNPIFSPSVIWGGLIALGALALLAGWRTRTTWPHWANLSALGMRAIALACAGVLTFQPQAVRQETRQLNRTLLVLVDDSQSMKISDESAKKKPTTRAETGQPALARLLQAAKNRNWPVHAYDIGDALHERQPNDEQIRSDASTSALGDLLQQAVLRSSAADAASLGASVIFSDGCVNVGCPIQEAASALKDQNVPFFAVVLGKEHPLPPDAVLAEPTARGAPQQNEKLETLDTATGPELRVGATLIIEARAWLEQEAPGRPQRTRLSGPLADTFVKLMVAEPGRQASAQTRDPYTTVHSLRHRIRETPAFTPIRFRFQPSHAGAYRFRISIEPFLEEQNLSNNVAYASAEVLPPRSQLVYITSRLGHDYRRFKTLFSTWKGPPVEMISDFLRPNAEDAGASRLWPAERVLSRRLSESNPNPGHSMTLIWAEPDPTHLSPKTQALLRAALQSGEVNLAWIVNEPAAELAARLRNSPLEDTFLFSQLIAPPIPARPPGQLISAAPAALNHPATQWSFQPPAGSPSAWQHLGNTLTWGGFEQPRENTSILLQSGNQPLLSVGQVGKGRVALFACGETWRWLTPDPQDTTHLRSALHIASLWEHLVEWLSQTHQAPEPPLRIHLPKTHWTASATMRACASVRGLAPDEPIRVEYIMVPIDQEIQTSRASEWRLWGADEGRLMLEHLENRKTTTLRDEPPRNVRGAWPAPAQRGEWALKARVLNEAHQTIGRDEVRFLVEGSTLEEASVWPDREGLEAAVSVAGTGGLYAPDEKSVDALIKHLEPHLKPSIITRERRSSAINANVLLALLILTLAVDAWLRRG